MPTVKEMERALEISRELYSGGPTKAEVALRNKCDWEHMTRTAVILEWGDPREWSDAD